MIADKITLKLYIFKHIYLRFDFIIKLIYVYWLIKVYLNGPCENNFIKNYLHTHIEIKNEKVK